MHTHTVPFSKPQYKPPIDFNSDLFGCKPSLNTDYNCSSSDEGSQYPYVQQDHLALRQLAFKNYTMPRTLDGRPVHKPPEEGQYSCDCNLASSAQQAKYNSEALKYEVKGGVLKRGCDCLKRNGLQDQCPRVRHEDRWRKLEEPRPHYDNHLHRKPIPPYENPCESTFSLPYTRLPHENIPKRVKRLSQKHSYSPSVSKPLTVDCKVCT